MMRNTFRNFEPGLTHYRSGLGDLSYGVLNMTPADLALHFRIQSGDAALKAEYQKKYGATWYIPWGQDQDRLNALYLAAQSDDARLNELANNPQPLASPAGAYNYSLHDMNRWKAMGSAAFQDWLATVGNRSAANYYAQVSGYRFSIVTPVAGSTEPTPAPIVSGTPAPPPPTIDPYAGVPRDETGAVAGALPPLPTTPLAPVAPVPPPPGVPPVELMDGTLTAPPATLVPPSPTTQTIVRPTLSFGADDVTRTNGNGAPRSPSDAVPAVGGLAIAAVGLGLLYLLSRRRGRR